MSSTDSDSGSLAASESFSVLGRGVEAADRLEARSTRRGACVAGISRASSSSSSIILLLELLLLLLSCCSLSSTSSMRISSSASCFSRGPIQSRLDRLVSPSLPFVPRPFPAASVRSGRIECTDTGARIRRICFFASSYARNASPRPTSRSGSRRFASLRTSSLSGCIARARLPVRVSETICRGASFTATFSDSNTLCEMVRPAPRRASVASSRAEEKIWG